MKIIYEKTKYYHLAFEYAWSNTILDYCRSLKNTYGFQNFTFSEGKWRFNDPSIVFLIQERFPMTTVDPMVIEFSKKDEKEEIEVKKIEERAIELKEATVSGIEIKGIKGELREYQKIGVEFFMNSGGRAILADEMGSGKTLQTLAYLTTSSFKRALVVSPASVKSVWELETKKWTNLESFVVDSSTDFSDIPHTANVVIINYDILKKHLNELLKMKWDAMICDESQAIKSPTAIRTKAVKMLSKEIPHIIFLSGTPLLSRPIELFSTLNMVDGKTWSNYYNFATKYCEGHRGRWGFEARGASNLDELSSKIGRYFLRRTKDVILSELPPKNRIPMQIDLEGESKKHYSKASNSFASFLKENKGKKDREILKSLQAEKLVKINYLREISVMGRMGAAKELIDSIVDAGEKVLVFSSFNAPLQELHDEYLDSLMIVGDTPLEERGEIVKQFQENPNKKVFFGGFRSAGTGITLTAASNVIFLDFPWNPADSAQAEDRVHRPGQKATSINIYQLYTKGTLDGFMMKLLERKRDIFNKVIGVNDNVEGQKSMTDELIEMLEEENEE